MRDDEVRQAVQEFFTRQAPGGRSAADAFPAWWLHHEFELSPTEAAACSSTGSYDHGLDAFHIEEQQGRNPTLHLVQAKFTNSRQQIRDGVRGFRRTLDRLSRVVQGAAPEDTENDVWVRLKARLEGREPSSLVLHCRVIHLAQSDEDALWAEAKAERADFEEAAEALFPDNKIRLSLTGPGAIGSPKVAVVPAAQRSLQFDGVRASSAGHDLFIGLGKLADLVRLYEETGDVLFQRNVRLFDFKAAEKGPARHLRKTLQDVCIGRKIDALHFTLFHNGVTLHVTSAERVDGALKVRKPGVLNGCQTVKSAWRFKNDRALRERIDSEAWEALQVPLRVVRTTDDELVRRVTVSNNRQTEVRPSGFRANDPLQLELSERLRRVGIFYERQEHAFLNLKKGSPKTLESEYPNSFDAPLKMEELAQALATVSVGPALSVASKVGDLFETPVYERLFADKNLAELGLLVFSTNILRCVHLALKDMREKAQRLEPLAPSRFRFLATRVLVRWVVKREPELVREFGESVVSKPGTKNPFRDRLRRLLSPQNTRLQTAIPELWGGGDVWPSATDKDLSEQLLRQLKLSDVDVFERYSARP